MQKKKLIEVSNLSKEFDGVVVLEGVDFDLYSGEIHSLVGENGAGKSTFIKILSGIYQPTSGEFKLEGEPVSFDNPGKAEMLGIRTVHQEINLVPFFSVAENIFLGDECLHSQKGLKIIDSSSMRRKAGEVLDRLGVQLDVNTPVHRLDASMERIVQLCRVLASSPKVVIFDEPTTSLGERERRRLLEIISDLKKTGLGIIYVSHNLDEVLTISDRITVLRDGRKIGTINREDATAQDIVRMMIGTKGFDEYSIEKVRPSSEVCLEVRGLTTAKIKQLSFELHRGEVLGIAGVVGAGKSELAEAIFGLDPLLSGEIRLNGKLYRPSPQEALKNGIALVPEERQKQGLIPNMTVLQNLTLSYLEKWCHRGVINKAKEVETTRSYIDMLNIKTRGPNQIIRFLSGGNQQKVILARWLAGDFQVGVFDEPTKGIDVKARADIYALIHRLSQQGKAIIMMSSYLPELLGVCHRILVLRNGRLCGEYRPTDDRVQEKIMTDMLGGGAA